MKFPRRPFAAMLALGSALLVSCAADVHRNPGAGDRAEFMLSFDDGPLPMGTERVLDSLARLKAVDGKPVRAGFFLLADAPEEFWPSRGFYAPYELWVTKGSIAKFPKLAQEIRDAGHLIGNHTTHHAWFRWPWLDSPEGVRSEIVQWEAVSRPVLGPVQPRLFRPPYLILTPSVVEAARTLGYRVVLGETSGDANPGIQLAGLKEKTLSILRAWNKPYPCVLIFHDVRPVTYQHLEEVVVNLQSQGFRLVHFDPRRI